jgi:hypothetical protein
MANDQSWDIFSVPIAKTTEGTHSPAAAFDRKDDVLYTRFMEELSD